MDGAEIRESVIALLALSKAGSTIGIFAPDKEFAEVDHLTGQETGVRRNVLTEAARIARGNIKPLTELKASEFDALIIPGGYGVAKNLSDLASKGAGAAVEPVFKKILEDFASLRKPIGAICIAPAVLAAALGAKFSPLVTIGEDKGTAEVIRSFGALHKDCQSHEVAVDEKNLIATCSAYMRDDELARIADGIEKVVVQVMSWAKSAASNNLKVASV